jgi:hypothetical protein
MFREPAPHGQPAVYAVRRTERGAILRRSWSEMIEPAHLSAVPEVGEAWVFEEFFLAHQERLFQALYLLTGERSDG